jgi:Lysozyme like domain
MPGSQLPTQPSGTYNLQQLEALWIQAGGSIAQAPLMASIAMAESAGNPNAHNASGATGLWQILGNPFAGNAYDPLTNARMAVAKYKSQGLGAWTTYTSGAYKPFLSQATSALQTLDTGQSTLDKIAELPGNAANAIGSAAGTVGSAANSLGSVVGFLTSPTNWLRIGEVIVGVLLILMGLRSLSGNSVSPSDLAAAAAVVK